MKNLTVLISIFYLLACNQNKTDESVIQDPFVENALSVLEELSKYYPPEDIDVLVRQANSFGYQTATFSLKGETKEIIELGSFAKRPYAYSSEGTTCSNKWQYGKEIAKCLDNGDDAVISNGPCEEASLWCVKCVEPS